MIESSAPYAQFLGGGICRSLERTADFPASTTTPLGGWLDRFVPYVRARVCRALGLPDTSRHELSDLFLRRHARVDFTPAHVDVTFPLASHPVEIRRALLDRDPGFVPAAGRHIAFHFD